MSLHHCAKLAALLLTALTYSHVAMASDEATARRVADFSLPAAELDLSRGVNIDRWLVAQPPFKDVKADDIRRLRAAGFRYVRLPVNPAPFLDGGGFHEDRTADLKQALELILGEGMPVLLVVHPLNDFKTQWLHKKAGVDLLCPAFAGFAQWLARWPTSRVALTLMAEPFGPTGEADWDWASIQDRLLAALRTGLRTHLIVLTGDEHGQIKGLLKLHSVDDRHVVYDFHFYEPSIFTSQGGQWMKTWPGVTRYFGYFHDIPYPSSPESVARVLPPILESLPPADRDVVRRYITRYGAERWDREHLRALVEPAFSWAKAHRATLMCGEFGAIAGAPSADRARYLRELRKLFEEHSVGWAIWAYHTEFRIVDRNRHMDVDIVDALFGPRAAARGN